MIRLIGGGNRYTRPLMVRVRSMVFNAHFNDGSVISWRSVLLVEETGGIREVTERDSNSR
jgi:hypothetical protein